MSVSVAEEVGLTDVGRQRQSNEDSFVEAPPVFAVADGMGGARAGEVASRLAVEAFDEFRDQDGEPEARLAAIARAANRRIYELAHSDEAYAGMGTTLTAVEVTGREVSVGHVGDSRLYRLREGRLERLTTDHSLVEEYVRAGRIPPEEAESHPQKSIITRALGVEADVEVDTLTCDACPGDVYLICSDGLTGMLSEADVASILRERGSLEEAARTLIQAANQAGGRDNITVVLFRLTDADATSNGGDESDTLSGRETQTALRTSQVRSALAAAEADRTTAEGERTAAEADRPSEAPADVGQTLVVDAATAETARSTARSRREGARRPPSAERRAAVKARRRRALGAVATLAALAALAAGLWIGGRQAYFVGTSDAGVIALYQGLPYELPFGIDLYQEVYESTLPAGSIPEPQRGAVLDHELRGRADAEDLVRQLERRRTVSPVSAGRS